MRRLLLRTLAVVACFFLAIAVAHPGTLIDLATQVKGLLAAANVVIGATGNGQCLQTTSDGSHLTTTGRACSDIGVATGTSLSLPKFNNLYYIDGTIYPFNDTGIHSAVADAIANGGGTVYLTRSLTLTSRLVLGSSTTQVHLHLGKDALMTVAVTGGGNAICVDDGSGITGEYFGEDYYADTTHGSEILVDTTANVSSVLSNCSQAGTQHTFFVKDILLRGRTNAAGLTAMASFIGGASGTLMQNVTIDNFPGIGLHWQAPSGNSASVFALFNVTVAGGGGAAGARPIVFESTGTGDLGSIEMFHVSAENAGAGNKLIEITGNGATSGSGAESIRIIGCHLEAGEGGNHTVIGIDIKDANNIHIQDCDGTDGGLDLVKIEQTGANKTYQVVLDNIRSASWTNGLDDSISSRTVAAGATSIAEIPHYELRNGISSVNNGTYSHYITEDVRLIPSAFSSLTACAAGLEGTVAAVNDSSTVTWGATITGSSTNHVLAYCDGSAWTVMGK